ncbi:MAG: ribosomal-processing cysteine protease Prp [Treponema sp.]|nr:ribosomal-processing cysteine protease Prp [Treponema sp.]
MTSVLLVRGGNGTFRSCRADGHAGFAAPGSDIVCSAVSVLLRTTMQTLEDSDDILLEADTSSRGMLFFSARAKRTSLETETRLVYAGDFLEHGIASLVKEYPGNVELQIQTGE